ncbi:hypothetical protein LSM04_004528 [Trypanosoma melophagium]|uniref:uncharacterized protein n=1 Tax=Trypanosoma melophagium TaxID=715481 RepID=UPI003519E661|nr:hypothetical protein LSM04_004528 [Trypanosoma melophagium]
MATQGALLALKVVEKTIPSSSIETVKAAYRAKCRTEHPDVGGTDGRFREIAWAYEDCTRLVHERNHINNGETPL